MGFFLLRVLICRLDSTSAHFPALPGASPTDFLPSRTPEHNSFISWHDFISPRSPHYCSGLSPTLSSQADYFSCVATVLYTRKDNCLYRACPNSNCSKKVLDQHNGWFRCEKCNRDFPSFKYRLLLSVSPQSVSCLLLTLTYRCEEYIHLCAHDYTHSTTHTWLIPYLLPFIIFVCLRPTWLTSGITSGWHVSRRQLRPCWVTVQRRWGSSEIQWDKIHKLPHFVFFSTCEDYNLPVLICLL